MSFAYVKEPPLAKWVQRVTFHGRYLTVIILGLICFGMSTPGMSLLAVPLILSGLCAEFAVITGRYRWEWVSLPFMTTCLGLSAVFLFATTVTGFVVWLLIALCLTNLDRLVYLTLLAKELRNLPPTRTEV